MKLTIIMFILSATFQLQANERTIARMRNIMDKIDIELDNTDASDQELKNARKHLRQSLNILIGRDDRQPNPRFTYTCVPKDDDGRNPYSLAAKNTDTLITTKIPGIVFATKTSCTAAISKKRVLKNNSETIICAPTDRDGRSPYSIFTVSNLTATKLSMTYLSNRSCATAIADGIETRSVFGTCAPKDNDGRAPWVAFLYNFSSKSVSKNGAIFNNYTSCRASL